MKRKILSMVLCVAMLFSLMPVTAFAADEAEQYSVWVNGEQFTSENASTGIDCGDGTATYDPATNTVTLNNAQITNAYDGSAIKATGALTVNVASDSSITMGLDNYADGINTDGNLVLTGSGNLKISLKHRQYNGIKSTGAVTVNMDGELSVDIDIHTSYPDKIAGIYAEKDITISGDGDVTVVSYYFGLYSNAGDITISGNGDVTITSEYTGLYAYRGRMLISGDGTVNTNTCIHSAQGCTISDSRSFVAEGYTHAIVNDSGDVTISTSGDVRLQANYGITVTNGNLIFSGSGKVDITGGSSGYGILITQTGKQVLLNGTASPITIGVHTADNGYSPKAVAGTVGGTNFDSYEVTGNPESTSVVYTWKSSIPVSVTGVTLDKTSASIVAGATTTLTATVAPENATDKVVTWSSSDEDVATVADGVVTAVAAGTATITAKTVDGGYTATCEVTVTAAPVAVTIKLVDISETGVAGATLTLCGTTIYGAELEPYSWTSTGVGEVFELSPGTYTLKEDNAPAGYINAENITFTVESDGTITVNDGTVTEVVMVHEKAPVAVTGVSLDKTTASIQEGKTETLTATVAPTDADNQNVTWTTSNESVATVADGVVTAVAPGTATITVTTEEGSKTASCEVTVTAAPVVPVAVTGVSLDKTTASIQEGKTETLTATVAPTDADNQNVTWTTSNESVVTVADGVVTAVAPGTATITVTTVDGNKTASCEVTVTAAPVDPVAVTGVSLNKTTASIQEGKTETLTATVAPTDADNQNVTWTTSNESVATVADGVVTAVAPGTATITVTTVDGSKTASCEVTVTKKSSGGSSSGGGGGTYVGPSTTTTTTTTTVKPALTMNMQINNKVITANGKTFTYDVAPFIVGDRTMVPVRVIMETLGAKVDWNDAARTVTITMADKVLTMTIDQEIPGFGTAPFIKDDRTYVPIRYIMENAGAKVDWNATTGEIVITK